MFQLKERNVNYMYPQGLRLLKEHGIEEASRNGPVISLPGPIAMEYNRPRERVLFDPKRDANPFFHLMEAIWMLAGERTAEWPCKFNRQMFEYANDRGYYDGAYGWRWRNHFDGDQILWVIDLLKSDPSTRRAVIAMYDPSCDMDRYSTDIPCNTHIYFRLTNRRLHMTVCNRSNDAVWGAHGANAVHMSMLQELIALSVGVNVGSYYQISNNYHLYLDVHSHLLTDIQIPTHDPYWDNGWVMFPLVLNGKYWVKDAVEFMDDPKGYKNTMTNPFFYYVARPLYLAWDAHKAGQQEDALSWASQCEDKAWTAATLAWLNRRYDK